MMRRTVLAALWLACTTLLIPAARADEAMWALLKGGGQVILIRHALTTPGVGDPQGMVLSDCASQRNLSDEGRAHAALIGQAMRARGVNIAQVLSSPWCRCQETARLAFRAEPQVSSALGNIFGRPELQARQVEQLKPLVSRRPAAGNVVMVSHGSTILALTGVSPATGEMVIVTPRGNGQFTVAGRLEVPAR